MTLSQSLPSLFFFLYPRPHPLCIDVQAHAIVSEQDNQIKELKTAMQQLQQTNTELRDKITAATVAAAVEAAAVASGSVWWEEKLTAQDYIKELQQDITSSAAVMKHLKASLNEAQTRCVHARAFAHATVCVRARHGW